MSDTEAPVEVKKRGRPAKKDTGDVAEKEAKKRGHTASPKKDKSPAVKESAVDNENGEAPAKRGRGRPPKKGGATAKKAPVAAKSKAGGRGRGRPPKAKAPASSEDNDDEEEEEDEED
uniref:Putative high mobility group protein i-like isoform x1 n=1 Tax=Nyssomyia neivai TaxID=330878 RepID=A0A1L8DAK7_9DIPT